MGVTARPDVTIFGFGAPWKSTSALAVLTVRRVGGVGTVVSVKIGMTNDPTLGTARGKSFIYSPANMGANLRWTAKQAAAGNVPTKYLPKN